jgi:hypothetical protein
MNSDAFLPLSTRALSSPPMSMRARLRPQAQSECAAKRGFALVHVTNRYMDVALAQAGRSDGGAAFRNVFKQASCLALNGVPSRFQDAGVIF